MCLKYTVSIVHIFFLFGLKVDWEKMPLGKSGFVTTVFLYANVNRVKFSVCSNWFCHLLIRGLLLLNQNGASV